MTGMSRACLVSPGTNGGISMDSHLSSAVCTYDCMHKYGLHAQICLQRITYVHHIACTYLYPNNYTHACGHKLNPCTACTIHSNIHKHALRCGLNCIFKLVTQKITYLHYIKCKTFAGSSLPADVRSIRQYFKYSISQRDSPTCRCLY